MGSYLFKCVVNCSLREECRSCLNPVILIDQWNEFWPDVFYSFDLLCRVHLVLAQVWKTALTSLTLSSLFPVYNLSFISLSDEIHSYSSFRVKSPCYDLQLGGRSHRWLWHRGRGMLSGSKRRLIPCLTSYEKAKLDFDMCILSVRVSFSGPIMAQSVNKTLSTILIC